jgi:hypothetical protein
MRYRTAMLALLIGACSSSPSNSPQPSGTPAPSYAPTGKIPPATARRTTPPPAIADHAPAVGAGAPLVALADTGGGTWTLGEALAKHARVMLVFYRGDW